MAINKKLIHFKTKAAFEAQLAGSNILGTSIVFIQDANLIWTHGTYYCLPNDDVVISDGIEPDKDQDLWIDTSDNTTVTSIEEAPIDGKKYVRKNGTWVATFNEVYIGKTEPTNGEIVWINPDTDVMKYFDGIQWVTVGGRAIPEETLIINLVSNQDEISIPDPDLLGKVIHVIYGDQDKELVWQGKTIKTTVPLNMTYQVVFPMDGRYKCPEQQEYTATAGNIREVKGYYYTEAVTVNVTCDDDTSAEGQKVTINGTVYDVDSTGSVTAKVPFDVSYTVSVDAKSGYTSPSNVSETANSKTKTIPMEYSLVVNVFIEAKDGTLYKSTEWNGTKIANSIVVKQPTASFRIALTQSGSDIKISDHYYDTWEDKMSSKGSEDWAKSDMNSATNTSKMLEFNGWNTYAAGYCASYTFPDGNTKGLLPALGWLQIAYDNKAAVDACLAACGGDAMKTNDLYWSSTFYGDDHGRRSFWVYNWENGHVTYFEVSSTFYTRPFAEYNQN